MTVQIHKFAASVSQQECLEEANEIISAALSDGKLSRRLLRAGIAQVISENACRHCQTTRAEADQMDADPRIDRHHHRINGKSLTPRVWAAFELLYRLRQPVTYEQFFDEGVISPRRRIDNDVRHSLRQIMHELRAVLKDSGFSIATLFRRRGQAADYELLGFQNGQPK